MRAAAQEHGPPEEYRNGIFTDQIRLFTAMLDCRNMKTLLKSVVRGNLAASSVLVNDV